MTSKKDIDDVDLYEKLCKKVSELTLVIHKVYTDNFKLETEIEFLKNNFTTYLKDLQYKHETNITNLKKQMNAVVLTAQSEKSLLTQNGKFQNDLQVLTTKYKDTMTLMKLKDESLDQYRTENQTQLNEILNLKEKLNVEKTNNHEQEMLDLKAKLENLMNSHAEAETKFFKELKLRDQALLTANMEITRSTTNHESETLNHRNDVAIMEKLMQKEKDRCNELENTRKRFSIEKQHMELENRKLTKEIKQLQDQLFHFGVKGDSNNLKDQTYMEYEAIMERDKRIMFLQQELQRYRLELINREHNFNRMFSRSSPVLLELDRRDLKPATYDLTGTNQRCTFMHAVPHLPYLEESSTKRKGSSKRFLISR